jgi:hypothetical protein
MKDFFFWLIPPLLLPNPFSLAINVPKEKSKGTALESMLESIPSASLGFADSPYDVAISHQSPPCVFVPLSRPSFHSVPQTHFLIHSCPHNIYICNCFPKLHSPVIPVMQIWSSTFCPFFIFWRSRRGNSHIGPSLAPFWLIFPC